MKIFEDKGLKIEIQEIHFGMVEAGTSKEKKVWLYNDLKGYLQEIQADITPKRDDIEIVKIPLEMGPEEIAPLVLKWSPSLKLEEGLSVKLKIKALEVFQADRGKE